MAGRGGKRTGAGRKVGPNKATIEKAIIAERVMNEAAMSGRKLGKEVIEEFMVMFGGLAGMFQPTSLKQVLGQPAPPLTPEDIDAWAKSHREPLFEKYSKLVLKAATELADFQSPRLAHVQTAAAAPESRGQVKKKFTVGIFDGQGRKAPRHITVVPNSSVMSPAKLN